MRVVARGRADEARLFSENHVYLGTGPVHFDAADGLDEIRGEIVFRDHAEEGAFGIGIGEHDAGADLSAVFEDDAAHSSAARIDLLDRAAGADFRSEASGRRGHSVGDGAHATHDVSVEALLFALTAAEEVEQQPESAAGLVRAAVFAIDIVGKKQCFYLFGFVVTVEEVTEAAGQERDQLRDLSGGDSAKAFAGAEQVGPSVKRLCTGLGRRLEKKWLEITS